MARHAIPGYRGFARTLAVCAAIVCTASFSTTGDAEPDQSSRAQQAAKARSPQFGTASVYARMLEGHTTASGEKHEGSDLTAAHRTLPLGTEVRVTNLSNHRAVVVRINDRGPQVTSRIIDLSPAAAAQIGLRSRGKGLARVRLDVMTLPPDTAQGQGGAASMEQKRTDRASKELAREPAGATR
ncbi:MAG: septal ring lytic transglycosylase RlpA family protein [Pseudomonadota bacterium]|nr:septal ring lytic transglycosylase RlpA family protein [Pseudomonadota bacterium]